MKNKVMILAFAVLILGFVLCACENDAGGTQNVEVKYYKPPNPLAPSISKGGPGNHIAFIQYIPNYDYKHRDLYHEPELFISSYQPGPHMSKISSGQDFVEPNFTSGSLDPGGWPGVFYARIDFNDSKYYTQTTYYFGTRTFCVNNNGSITYSDIVWETTGFTKDW